MKKGMSIKIPPNDVQRCVYVHECVCTYMYVRKIYFSTAFYRQMDESNFERAEVFVRYVRYH